MSRAPELWIACKVIDNFGDAGVCWRLARQLAAEHALSVSLLIEGEATLAAIEPSYAALRVAPSAGRSDSAPNEAVRLSGVNILPWASVTPGCPAGQAVPDIVISAFGCELPGWLRQTLAGGPRRPLWVNLEYLSAEAWIDGCHGLVSIKPDDGAREHFFYPGFSAQSGGLIREAALQARRDHFRSEGGPARFLAGLGAQAGSPRQGISLFCYPQAPLHAWLRALVEGPGLTLLCVAGGCAQDALTGLFGRLPALGESTRIGCLEVLRLPMLSQDDYDRLLWSCEVNFVRGEDSWVRAHWAGAPFIWQPYVQADGVHLNKLQAFLDRLAGLADHEPGQSDEFAAAATMMRAWSDPSTAPIADAWRAFERALPRLRPRYEAWGKRLAGQPGLASALARYCLDRI